MTDQAASFAAAKIDQHQSPVYGRRLWLSLIITGGAGGMGVATAEIVGRDRPVVQCDVRRDRLDARPSPPLTKFRHPRGARPRRRHRPEGGGRVFDTAAGLGTTPSVIHTAG